LGTAVASRRLLVLCIGNPARGDDGLGPAMAVLLEEALAAGDDRLEGVTIEADYQPTVEDAALVAEHETVVFIDASTTGSEPFAFETLVPEPDVSFSTHSLPPASVIALAGRCFGWSGKAWMLAIHGYDFEPFQEELSERARANLAAAAAFLTELLGGSLA
jgi:hydrogenase maturation protease